ncbi:MAG: hypothetical protein IBJ02_09700 [Brevundimonas sp.]|nr:hypothetical protein [Brevundimonas sp.]
MADGAYRWQGQAPTPDSARVDAIHDAWSEAEVGAFAEPIRAGAVEKIERALAAARTGDLTEAHAQLTHARSLLADLRPEALEPRRGLAGLFDSRSGRLKAFRETWKRAAASLDQVASDLSDRVAGAARRSGALDTAWTDIRDALVELDAHLLAAARRLSGRETIEATPDPLPGRMKTLDACRAASLNALPLIRHAQGAEGRSVDALKACTEGVGAWRDEWKDALGLAGKKPKKVRPDPDRLGRARDALMVQIDRALAELTTARTRRADVEGRLASLRQGL